ncbi:hemolysin XhlA family protein [Paenibacillus sp. 481]|uniref:hemolysin XhlA family protein n=1 Tax=Paenibacillus sp. 481 TaxID=2835869 RepID=UPI001E2D81E8|nr:hemolysin XhlA family protein [Paenibacillus sp. 481]UHA72308.1 hemolysin XhlA family protein [Paenibacillus sp. 481]
MSEKAATTEILERLARIETRLESISAINQTAEAARETAREALQSTKNAHQRLDRIEEGHKWLWRTLSGAVIVAVISIIFELLRRGGGA